jgi:hypothetical protein
MTNLKDSWYSELYERRIPLNIAINNHKYRQITTYLSEIAPYIDNTIHSAIIGIYPITLKPNEEIKFDPHLQSGITTIMNIDPTVKYKIELQDEEITIPATFMLPYTKNRVYLISNIPKILYICHFRNIKENNVYRPVPILTQYENNLLMYNEPENKIMKIFQSPITKEQHIRMRDNIYIYEKELEMQMRFEVLNKILNKYIL